MSPEFLRRFRYFRAGGATFKGAIYCARVEIRAEGAGLTVSYEPEIESYKSVYGEDPPEGAEFCTLIVRHPDDEHDVLASLGFVDCSDMTWARVDGIDVLGEALGVLDARAAEVAEREAAMSRAIDSVAATL